MAGRVLAIFVARAAGMPMREIETVLAAEGRGLVPDRYASGGGAFSEARPTIRHVTLIAFEAIREANEKAAQKFEWSETRRNIITEWVDLNSLVGKDFRVGDALLRGVELAEPCERPSQLARKPGFKEAFLNRGGLRAQVLRTGVISKGDLILY